MKELIFASFSMIILIACTNQQDSVKESFSGPDSAAIVYDSLLAKKYGADQLGMKKYVMAFLKKGPDREHDSLTAANIQKGHLENIQRMAREGQLILAGPFFGQGELRGIYVFNVSSITEAEELTRSDPAIQSGRLTMELKEWYGSAALMAVNEIHEKLVAPQ